MQRYLEMLNNLDLATRTMQALDFVENADLCFMGLVVGVLVCLGYKMASGQKQMMIWGPRLAVLTFLAHGGYQLATTADWETITLVKEGARSAVLAGAVLAVTWIVFPIVSFIYGHLRLGIAAFLVYCCYALVNAEEWTSEALPGIALRGGLAAGLAVVLAWIFQPLWDLIVPKRPAKPAPRPEAEPAEEMETEAPRRKKRRKRFTLIPVGRDDDDDPEEEVTRIQIEMRRRRDRARLTVELTYVLAMPDIGQQFPREVFENWVNRYLGDHLPPEDVEENSKQLQTLLAQQRKQLTHSQPSSSATLEELNHWLLEEQKRIHNSMLDLQEKQRKLLDLQEHYVGLVNRLLGEPTPAVVQLPFRNQEPPAQQVGTP